ncbi:hypothetical protein EJD96_21975 [Herbaspirillum seropedicae]|uniref:hypothetical protein n=1 Tax=Herbaspirillum seropedicae TaxID=964 RepID=UPI00111E68FE|nr:hypothetical protein [Herbaspirillum seropedicae]QDD66642.1 hypothetical protein EJD96_21975 [Herbaspirillum seropedicae]
MKRLMADRLLGADTESRNSFVKRRVARALKHGADESMPLWAFSKTAGVRESTILKFAEHLDLAHLQRRKNVSKNNIND